MAGPLKIVSKSHIGFNLCVNMFSFSYAQVLYFFWHVHSKTEVHQINEDYDQSFPKRNTKPELIERKQVDKNIESKISW